MKPRFAVLSVLALGFLSGCGLFSSDRQDVLGRNDPDYAKRTNDPYGTDPAYQQGYDELGDRFSSANQPNQGLVSRVFGSGDENKGGGGGGGGGPSGVGVNSYLWRATLDTVSFIPLASADPFGGVIITDWYSPPDRPNERFKVNVFILGRELRADGVRASVFRQTRDANGQWADAPVDQKTGTDLENAILTRARQMRLSTAQAQ
ncbi:MAG TPA: DUF3576 domain-containing protein [Stellaceae bacterium]|nr:DUF3576 domain-containing protein [Stellaceae bacterium]